MPWKQAIDIGFWFAPLIKTSQDVIKWDQTIDLRSFHNAVKCSTGMGTLAVWLNNQFLQPITNGSTTRSARLLSILNQSTPI